MKNIFEKVVAIIFMAATIVLSIALVCEGFCPIEDTLWLNKACKITGFVGIVFFSFFWGREFDEFVKYLKDEDDE